MKQIISKLRKCLCLTLSIFLLTSNMQIFAQELYTHQERLIQYFDDFLLNVKEVEDYLSTMSKEMNDPQKFLKTLRGRDHLHSYWQDLPKRFLQANIDLDYAVTSYRTIRDQYNNYVQFSKNITGKEVLAELSRKYSDKSLSPYIESALSNAEMAEIDKLFPKRIVSFVKSTNFVDFLKKDYVLHETIEIEGTPNYHHIVAYIEQEDVDKMKNAIKYMEDKLKEMREGIKNIERAKAELIKKEYTSLDILEYAYKNGMLPKEKAGVKSTLKAMDADVSLTALVKSIRQYLTDFGTKIKDVKYYPTASLMRELKGINLEGRTKYVDELTELESNSKKFIEDFNKLDRPAQRYIRKNIINGTWATVGIMIGLTLLFELIPQNSNANNINKSLEIVDTLDDIAYKIENGEATMPEMLYFYTIPENESLILNDPVHTFNFVRLTSGVMAAEELLETEQEETQATNENVENSILKRYMEMQQNKKVNVGNVNVADFSF